jgi:multicomponent Na+:H+ antiporter subunit D
MLAFSTIDDMGYLLLGVVAGSQVGMAGALLGALAHALFKVLLFGAVGVAERGLGRPLTLDDRGLAGRFPVSSAAFIAGALGMIGVPPLLGFAGRWRLYLSGLETGGVWLGAAMVLATVLALFYYTRAVHAVWLGSPAQNQGGAQRLAAGEPRLAAVTLAAVTAAAVLMGLAPAWLLAF